MGKPFGGVISGARAAVLGALLRTDEPLTGRQIHRITERVDSLWSIQEALKDLRRLGLVASGTVGRAGVHTVNNDHIFVSELRWMVSPMAALRATIEDAVTGSGVRAVILFGSTARREATAESDIDLAVIARPEWDDRVRLQDIITSRFGNGCDVLALTEADFRSPVKEPIIHEIVREGVARRQDATCRAGHRLMPSAEHRNSAEEAMVTVLTGTTSKGRDHAAPRAEQALRQLVSAKTDVEYGTTLLGAAKTEPLLRRARTLVDLASEIIMASPVDWAIFPSHLAR